MLHSYLKHGKKNGSKIANNYNKNNCICENMSSPKLRPDSWNWNVVPMNVEKNRQSVEKEFDN